MIMPGRLKTNRLLPKNVVIETDLTRMKVLYVSYDGMTDALGRSQVIPYLERLSAKGHKIHVVSCEKKQVDPSEREEVKNIFSQKDIDWSPLDFSTQPPGLSKIKDVYKIRRKVLALHKNHFFHIVHCRSYVAALASLKLKLDHGVKFVFDMRGFWANERIEGGMWSKKNPVHQLMYRYFKKKEKQFFSYADAVISLTHNGKGLIGEMFGESIASKTTVIPCCVDTQHFSRHRIEEDQRSLLKKELGIKEDSFVLSYLGSIGTWYMTDEMLLFYKKLKARYSNTRFLFISGDSPDFIMEKARLHGIDEEDIIISRAPRKLVPLYLSLSAVSIFFIRPVFSKRASSPTKQAEIMSMGIPLICNTGVGDTDMLFSDEKVGLVLRDFSDEQFNRAVDHMESVLRLNPGEIREKAIKNFNLDDGVEGYDGIYKSITQG